MLSKKIKSICVSILVINILFVFGVSAKALTFKNEFLDVQKNTSEFSPLPFLQVIPENYSLKMLQAKATQTTLPEFFNIITWNMQKQNHFDRWFLQFKKLSVNTDLFLTQEAIEDQRTTAILSQTDLGDWVIGKSFYNSFKNTATGVMTGSRVQIQDSQSIQTLEREPLLGTPKMMLVHQLYLFNHEKLLLVNLHGINFTSSTKLKNQLGQLDMIINNHKGPLIVAGDFNTWNVARKKVLQSWSQKHLLRHWLPTNETRQLHLDHLLTRYCEVFTFQLLNQIQTSDHYPLSAHLRCS